MEAPNNNDDDEKNSWSSEANWAIAYGSLDASITFDSSDSPIESEIVNSTVKSPLILKPSSPDCGPCEIKISFTQKHEVRQVYIRSTARVYEIYYAPGLQSSNEYLCTVRCGIASRDGELLHAADIEEPVANLNGSAGELAKEKFKHEGSVGSSEDDWVEVKVPDSPLQDNRASSPPENIDANRGTRIQDFYEATAEINDADPCISLTLRLLSLQNKECVYVDEIYIFGDPVESADSEQVIPVGNLAGSSLVAMFVPTLLQLSKTGISRIQDKNASDKTENQEYLEIGARTSQIQDKHDSGIMEKPDSLEIGSRTIDSTNIANATLQEENSCIADKHHLKLQDVNGATADQMKISEQLLDREEKHDSLAKTSQIQDKHDSGIMEKPDSLEIGSRTIDSTNIANATLQEEKSCIADKHHLKLQDVNGATADQMKISEQLLDREEKHDSLAKNDLPFSQIERTLEQLVSRVSKIEDICTRFEENMLKPISIMEARLQRVEQQMEVFTKNSQCSVLTCGTRFSAPAFSCNESGSSSFYNDGSDYPACGALDLKKEDSPSVNPPNQPEDVSTSISATQFVPSLVVTAPEFSCGDDEDENDALESQMDSPQEKPKQGLSIDDALAAALTRLLYTSNVQTTKCTQTLTVKAPEFTIEENGNDDEIALPSVQNEKPVVPSMSLCKSNGTEPTTGSVSTSSDDAFVEGKCHVMSNLNDDNFGETSKGVDGQNQFDEEGSSCGSLGTSVDCPPIQARYDSEKTDDCQVVEETKRIEASNGINNGSISDKIDIVKQFLGNQTEDSCTALQKDAAGSTEDIAEKGYGKHLLQNVLKSSRASSTLDFETPILDVKFASCGISSTKTPLEALLNEVQEYIVQTPHVQESDDGSVEHKNLSSAEDMESIAPLTDNHLLVDLESHDIRDVPSTMEGEELQHHRACVSDVMCTSLI